MEVSDASFCNAVLLCASLTDFVYFLLPSLERHNCAVFGLASFRQIDSQQLITRDLDVTRSCVQKSVGVITKLPLWGSLREKLELITLSYFEEKDFSKVCKHCI